MELVCIRGDIHGMTKGRMYRFRGSDRSAGTVILENDNKDRLHYQLDVDVIFMASGYPERDNPEYHDMMMSYAEAIEQAGGNPDRFIHESHKMTVLEMMTGLAPNRVRFTCKPKEVRVATGRREDGPLGKPVREIDFLEGNRG